jgi:DNA-binding CsgD family transcriptional regulator
VIELNPTEARIAELLKAGYRETEIARALNKNHPALWAIIRRMKQRIGARTTCQMVAAIVRQEEQKAAGIEPNAGPGPLTPPKIPKPDDAKILRMWEEGRTVQIVFTAEEAARLWRLGSTAVSSAAVRPMSGEYQQHRTPLEKTLDTLADLFPVVK